MATDLPVTIDPSDYEIDDYLMKGQDPQLIQKYQGIVMETADNLPFGNEHYKKMYIVYGVLESVAASMLEAGDEAGEKMEYYMKRKQEMYALDKDAANELKESRKVVVFSSFGRR